ncbi:MAG: ABC transporter permease [Bacillota bacterium]
MLRYLYLWGCYMRLNWLALMAYRWNFLAMNVGNLINNLGAVALFWVIFGHVKAIGSWSFEQVLFLYALSMLARATWHLFGVNVMSIGPMIHGGELDRLLVRPLNPLFQVIASYLDNDDWGELTMGIALLTVAVRRLGLVDSPLDLPGLAVVVLSGGLIYLAVHLAFNTVAFWTVRVRPIQHMAWDLDNFSRYPLDIYDRRIQGLLTFVFPFGFAAFYPAQTFFGTHLAWAGWLTPVVALAAFAAAYQFWLTGLRAYSGTGT